MPLSLIKNNSSFARAVIEIFTFFFGKVTFAILYISKYKEKKQNHLFIIARINKNLIESNLYIKTLKFVD